MVSKCTRLGRAASGSGNFIPTFRGVCIRFASAWIAVHNSLARNASFRQQQFPPLTSGELKEVANPKDDLLPHHPLVMVDFRATGTDYRSLTSELQGETIITTY